MNEDELLDYLTARIYALANQRHYIAGHVHPFYNYALKEFSYFVGLIAKLPTSASHRKGVYIARSIIKNLHSATSEDFIVYPLSSAQAYRLAQSALYYEIDLKTAIEIDCEDND